VNDPYSRARSWLQSKAEPAISGSNGHDTTLKVARVLVNGFALSEGDCMALMREYSATCQPPWSERELEHKISDAARASYDKPRGYLLQKSYSHSHPRTVAHPPTAQAPKKPIKTEARKLPDPLPDGTRELIRHVFRPGEGIRIANASSENGQPTDSGPCLGREDWLKRLDDNKGDPDRIWYSVGKKSQGIFVSCNPMKIGGSRDSDVTDFRHALLEFDTISPEEQYGLYLSTKLPCAAIISSGGKSVHAWVKIDARDRREYDERVKFLYSHFGQYRPDNKNKNPSRFSRLPNCERGNKRQELLALNVGCTSWAEWAAEIQAEGVGEIFTVDQLSNYDTAKDANTILGSRWLCKGGSCLMVGPSGVGKSSLVMQLCASWAIGKPAFGITPIRPLKVLLVQAENDEGDMAEMLHGVMRGLEIDPFSDEFDLLSKNLVFVRDTTHTGDKFASAISRLIDKHKPDLGVFDPLLSFVGGDISRQDVCSHFLRALLNPISDATGVAWFAIHHTGKPPADKQARAGWQSSDWSYSGIGSSELVNWARAVMVLKQVAPGAFGLKLPKRGKRAGAIHPTGEPTDEIYLRHSDKGIFWEQIEPPEEQKDDLGHGQKKRGKAGAPSKAVKVASMNLHSFLRDCRSEGESQTAITKRLMKWLASSEERMLVSDRCIETSVLPELHKNKKLNFENDLWYAGSNK
jgi:RecA-family ATPase